MKTISCLLLLCLNILDKTFAYIPSITKTSVLTAFTGRRRTNARVVIVVEESLRQQRRLRSSSFTFIRLHAALDGRDKEGNIRKGPLEFLLDPKPTKIPPELRDEIFMAEANTVAARERQTRVLLYTLVAVLGISFAFLNVFLTELRSTVGEAVADVQQVAVQQTSVGSVVSLEDIGWGWVESNILFHFLLANKIGGALSLVGGAGSAMMVEAEIDSQRANAEQIWEELERRRNMNDNQAKKKNSTSPSASSSSNSKKLAPTKKKQPSGTQKKRLAALSEVVLDAPEDVEGMAVEPGLENVNDDDGNAAAAEKEGGIMGKLKGWYNQADSMAAAQALLLNKELEDRGVLEKITDETGLRVIGRDAAAKLKEGVRESKEE